MQRRSRNEALFWTLFVGLGFAAIVVRFTLFYGPFPATLADGSPHASGSRVLEPPPFPFEARSSQLAVMADVAQPVADLLVLGEQVLDDLRARYVPDGQASMRPFYSVYLCEELETLRVLEQWHGLPRSDPGPERSFAFRGGFYPEVGMVAILASADEDTRWNFTHELSHAVFREAVGRSVDAIDEGMAEYVAAQAYGDGSFTYHWTCAKAVERRGVPTLKNFFGLDYWQFRDQRMDWQNYGLSWLLVDLLLEGEEPEVQGRFPRLMRNLREASDPWEAMERTYDTGAVERLWHASVERRTRWIPQTGAWEAEFDPISVEIQGGRAAHLLHRARPRRGVPYELAFRLADLPERAWGIGFLLAYEDPDDYWIVSLRNHDRDVVLARRGKDEWSARDVKGLAELPPDPRELTLRCDAQGTITLLVGGSEGEPQEILRRELGVRAFAGAVGLFVEQRHCPDSQRMRFQYERASFQL